MGRQPSPDDIRTAFERDGYYKPVRVMSAEEARAFRLKVESFEREHPDKVGLLDMKANVILPWIDEVTRNAPMLDAIEAILGPDILCENVGFRNKAPDGKTYVSWHQDTPYIKIKPLLITCWLALTPATAENGCLRVIPGSHKWPLMRHAEKVDPNSMLTRGHYIAEPFDESGAVDVVLEPGEGVLLNYNIVHSSKPNRSKDRRMGMLIDCISTHAVKEDNRESAMLIRGVDRVGNFELEVPPATEVGPAEIARHKRAVELVVETFYAGSGRVPEALSGKARNQV